MPQVFSNGARAKLDTSIGFDNITLTISSGGSLFPVANYSGAGTLSQTSPENWFKLVIQDDDGMEVVYCYEHTIGSNIFGNLRRGQEGTTARAFTNEAIVGLRPLAKDMADLVQSNKTISESLESKADKTGNITGNAGTATKLESPRAISISGGVTAAAKNFDGTMPLDLEVTALDVSKANQGTLAVNRGGTGTTTSTGSGSVVLSQSPTLTGTPLAPTAPVGTNTDQVATAALVKATADGKVDVVAGSRLITNTEAAKIASNEAALASKVSKTSDTGAAQLPSGTEAQRPDPSVVTGLLLRGNETTGKVEYYDRVASSWKTVGSNGGELFDYAWHNGPHSSIDVGRVATDGQQLLLLTHPDVCQAIWDGKQNVVDESVWQADPTKRNCWSSGDGTSWVRVPDLNAAVAGTGKPFYLRGGTDALSGTSVGDAIRNITGSVTAVMGWDGGLTGSEALTSTRTMLGATTGGSTSRSYNTISFNASASVPTADENRVKTAYGVMTVRVFTEVSNVGALDAGQLATQLGVVDAKVQNLPKHTYGNKIINGKMDIAQRGTSFPALAGGNYALDRWFYGAATSGVITVSREVDGPAYAPEFLNSLRVTVTTADTSVGVGRTAHLVQRIEGYNVRDLIGKTFTLSFWVRSSKTGIHCVAFRNSGPDVDRSYITEYMVNVANTWEYKTVIVTGGITTSGSKWNWTNGVGLQVQFGMMAGASWHTTPDAWQSGDYYTTPSQVNCLDTVGNIFAITGVQLEVGEVATPFEHRPYGVELALCKRYYESLTNGLSYAGFIQVAGLNYQRTNFVKFEATKRAPPSCKIVDYWTGAIVTTLRNGGGNSSADNSIPAVVASGVDGLTGSCQEVTPTAITIIYNNFIADAEL